MVNIRYFKGKGLTGLQVWHWVGEWRQIGRYLTINMWWKVKVTLSWEVDSLSRCIDSMETVIIETHLFYHLRDTSNSEAVFIKAFQMQTWNQISRPIIWHVWLVLRQISVWIITTSWLWLEKQCGLDENCYCVKVRGPSSSWLDK